MRNASFTRALTAVLVPLALAATVRPAFAQVDLSGFWQPLFSEDRDERIPGPPVADYLGLPINDADRLRADTWDAELLTLPEHQCKPHPSTYGFRGVGELRIEPIIDGTTEQVVAWQTHIQWQEQERTIWMDGRPHPPEYAAHTWQGFSTGHWEGDQLVVHTDHLKAGWIRRNGLALTDEATLTDRFIRHGPYLTHVMIVEDPNYLTEPLVKTNGFLADPDGRMAPYPCQYVDEVGRPRGEVPSHLPGENPFLHEFADRYGIPFEATRGGAETALPEYEQRIAELERQMHHAAD